MKIIIYYALPCFLAFAALGYLAGRSEVTSEHYIASMIANNTDLRLTDGILYLDLREPNSSPYWSLNLNTNKATFKSIEKLLDSMHGKTLSAEGTFLLTFISGGAATTTAATVF